MSIKILEDGSLEFDVWVKKGSMRVRRDCLDVNDPDHVYNYLKSNGVEPENYGIEHPYNEKFKDVPRGELIERILKLERELESIYFNQGVR